jgi:hypothetical protein
MISVLGLVNGLSGEVRTVSKTVKSSNIAIISQKNIPTLHDSRLNWSIVELIQQHPSIKEVLPQQLSIAAISEPLSNEKIQIEVYGLALYKIMDFYPRMYVEKGELPSSNISHEGMLGSQLIEKFIIKEPYPINITIQTEKILSVNLTGKFRNAGRYTGAIVVSHEFFGLLFPRLSTHLSFIEVKLRSGSENEKNAETIQTTLNKAGYNCKVTLERGQEKISTQILKDILAIFWTFSIVIFLVIALQMHYATKWIGLRFIEEFQLLRALGITRVDLIFILMIIAFLLGNLAFTIAVLIGLPLGTASLAVLTLFSGTTRFYAGVEISDLIILFALSNVFIILGSFYQAWTFTSEQNMTLDAQKIRKI